MNPSKDTRWIELGSLSDIPVRGARRVAVGTLTIAVFRTAGDELYALEDRCPHRGGPLSQGIVHGDCVTCPLHELVIGLGDGAARGADEGAVARYALRRDGDAVLLAPDAPIEAAVGPAGADAREVEPGVDAGVDPDARPRPERTAA